MSHLHRDPPARSARPLEPSSSPLPAVKPTKDPSGQISLSDSVRFLRHSPSSSLATAPVLAPSSELPSDPSPPQNSSPPTTNGKVSGQTSPPTRPQRFSRPLLSSMSSEDVKRASPKDRLNAFLASPSSSNSSPGNPPTAALPAPPPIPPSFSNAKPPLGSQPRNVSAPLLSSVTKAATTEMAAPVERSNSLRNMSVDSAPSSAPTSTSVSQQTPAGGPPPSPVPSPDSAANTGLDAAALIANSGSPEAALEKLLKEKQATASRSDQLWKLVEKQRAMILGLNKDLERALQDKERYRKKVKEYQASRESSSKSAAKAEDKPSSSSSTKDFPAGDGQALNGVSSKKTGVGRSADNNALQTFQTTKARDTPLERLIDRRTESALSQRTSESETDRQTILSTPPRGSKKSVDDSSKQQLSPIGSTVESPKLSISTRRAAAAPAPLNLSATATSATTQHFRAFSNDSDYDQTEQDEQNAQVVDSPPVERGRQKTREDDDRLREQVAIEEEEKRQASKSDGSKSKSRSATGKKVVLDVPQAPGPNNVDGQTATAHPIGLPTSPRAPVLGGLQSPLHNPNMGSIASTLQPVNAPPIPQQATKSAIPPHLMAQKSPGLPMSPRPGDRPMNSPMPRMPKQPLASPGPPTPRAGLPFSPRAPTKPIPLPPSAAALGIQSPHLARAEQYHQRQRSQTAVVETMADTESSQFEQRQFTSHRSQPSTEVFKGFVSEQYPDLLIPPNALPLIEAKIYSSRLRPSRNSVLGIPKAEEDPIFTLAIHSRSDNQQLWRVEKTVSALFVLDQEVKAEADVTAQLPDRSLFSGHAPVKIDARRLALVQYFDDLLNTQMSESAALVICAFFSSDVIAPNSEQTTNPQSPDLSAQPVSIPEKKIRTEGYLGKKGKQFGGWKARYFVIDGAELRYFEAPGGPHLGNIKLHNAQIAKQNAKESDEDAEFRHAFMILEPKRKDSSSLVRHVLCAESDEERDDWVEALMQHVDGREPPVSPTSTSYLYKTPSDASQKSATVQQSPSSTPQLQSLSYEETIAAEAPVLGTTRTNSDPPSFDDSDVTQSTNANGTHPNISGPVSGGPIQNVSAWGNKQPSPTVSREKDTKKSKMFGFISRTSEDGQRTPQPFPNAAPPQGKRKGPLRAVFGIPLSEAAEICPPVGINLCLPSPVYRCIEYLQGRNALKEEGIFRLSGSSVVIKALKERFNTEGDVKLLGGQYYDIHAVASLLKLYLRELPDPVLTRELHLDFLKVLDLDDRQQKINAASFLVHKLPESNLELLNTLSGFLIDIVNNSEINKMTVRNVGIVFAPTLNIPAPLLSLFLEDNKAIFQTTVDPSSVPSSFREAGASSQASGRIVHQSASSSSSNSITMDDMRSPRKQMFSEVTTPAPDQTSFPGFQPMTMYQGQQQQNPYMDPRMAYDTGFTPVQPPLRQPQAQSPPKSPMTQAPDPSGFGSLNALLSPGPSASFPSSSSSTAPIPPPAPTPSPGPAPGYGPPLQQASSSSSASASVQSTSSSPNGTPNLGSDSERRKQRRESGIVGASTSMTGVNGSLPAGVAYGRPL